MTASPELRELLERHKGGVVYVANVGNAGDAFIAHATYQLFEKLGVSYRIGELSGFYPDQIVICPGGGTLVPEYDNIAAFLQRNKNKWRKLIILPHTIRGYAELLRSMESNCFIFCREVRSFDFVALNAPKANVFLHDDLAFSCRFEETAAQMNGMRGAINFVRNPRLSLRLLKRLRRDLCCIAQLSKPECLYAFRTDAEKTAVEVPRDNIDVSHLFTDASMRPLIALHTTYRMVRFLMQFTTVKTNRLHIAIMSAMLGLNVDFWDNSYGKNRDVFEYSMRDRFTSVRWRGETQPVG